MQTVTQETNVCVCLKPNWNQTTFGKSVLEVACEKWQNKWSKECKRASERIYGHASYFTLPMYTWPISYQLSVFEKLQNSSELAPPNPPSERWVGRGVPPLFNNLTPKQCPNLQTASAVRLLQFHPIGKSDERVMHLWQPGINCVTSVFTGQRRFTRSFSDRIKW